jgi:hypothetical protein
MIQSLGRGDLSTLRHAGADLMAVVEAGYWIELGVTDAEPERRRVLRRPTVATQLMTSAARSNVAPSRLRARRVTTETGRMGVEISRDSHRHTAPRGTMTGRTTDIAHANVFRMIEFHPETHEPRGKRFQRA